MTNMIFRLIATVAGVPLSVYLLEGVNAADWTQAVIAGGMLAAFYLVLRPIARLVTGVFNFLTLGLLSILIDGWMVQLCAQVLEGKFSVDSYWWAVACAVIVNVLRFLIGGMRKHKK